MNVGVPYSQTNPNDLVEFDGFWKLGYLIFEDLELELLNEFHWSRLEQWSVPPPFYPFTLFTLLHALWHIYIRYYYDIYIYYITMTYIHIIYILRYDIMYYCILCIFLKREWKVGSSGSPNFRAVSELACSRSLGLDGAIAWCCWWWSKFTARHCPQTLGIRMVHSNSWLMDDYSPKYGNPENESSQGSLLLSNKNSQIQNPSTMGSVGAFGFTQQGKPCLQQSAALSMTSLSCIARLRRVATGGIATGIVLQLCPSKSLNHDRAKQAWKASLNMS